jgi:hypothetical protein
MQIPEIGHRAISTDRQKEGTMQENTREIKQSENISLADAAAGVLTEPGTTFDELKASTRRNYWIVPIIILAVITVIATFLVLNDEDLSSEIHTLRREAVKEQLDKAVKEGKMTQEKMDEVMEQQEKMFGKSSPLFLVFAAIGPVTMIFIALFFRGLVLWGAVKLFKGGASYMLVICVLGLASIIDSIQMIVNTAMSILMGKLNASISPALLFPAETVGKQLNMFLGHFDVFNIWYLIVIGFGLAKVSGLRNGQTMPVVFGLWLVWVAATTFLALPFVR